MLKKSGIVLQLFVLLLIVQGWVRGQEPFDRSHFYKAMASDKQDMIDAELRRIQDASFEGKQAFEGSLLMKKSGLIRGANKKLNLFKAGRQDLEGSIARDSLNAEYRFLRLMIQENAPGIVRYKNELDKDHKFIVIHFKNLEKEVRNAVVQYSKKSKILKPADF